MEQLVTDNGHQTIRKNPRDGIILIDKNEGESSFDVVKRLRGGVKVKKVGHAGTLDPFATGLLIILLGQGTKLSPFLMSGQKRYRASIRLGIETDTLDPTGRIIQTRHVPAFEPEQIKTIAMKFIGEIEQVPPIFSAVNYQGKRAYKLARKGIKVDLKKRRVKVHSIEIISIDLPEITMEICCSGGTYIRSLASDMGKQLGTGAHLSALRRLSSGPFEVKDAINSKQIGDAASSGFLSDRIIPLGEALPDMQEARVDDRTAQKIRNGYKPEWEEVAVGSALPDLYEGHIKLVNDTELVAVMEAGHFPGDNKGWLKKVRVFNSK
ncbi:MAG: tRNA pseudouridine(55) synthase TruB [Deltaproteobacteria bacterium]|nr:tRNA pseudouridine(55) synthase TruB [Deltaproteobacteria bacterium]